MARTTLHLPENYSKLTIMNSKKQAIVANIASLAIAAVMIIVALPPGPVQFVINPMSLLVKMAVTMLSTVLYIVLHELTHGMFMHGFSGVKPKYGVTGLYAYAGSSAYFNKLQYLVIGVSPVVLLGIVILGTTLLVPAKWFWVFYFVQILNVSGAAGDLYVTIKILSMSNDILIHDTGTAMAIYGPAGKIRTTSSGISA